MRTERIQEPVDLNLVLLTVCLYTIAFVVCMAFAWIVYTSDNPGGWWSILIVALGFLVATSIFADRAWGVGKKYRRLVDEKDEILYKLRPELLLLLSERAEVLQECFEANTKMQYQLSKLKREPTEQELANAREIACEVERAKARFWHLHWHLVNAKVLEEPIGSFKDAVIEWQEPRTA